MPISWRIDPSTKPADLGAHLERHGFTLGWEEPGIATDLLTLKVTLPKPTGLVIERVGDAKMLEQFCHTAVVGSGFPASIESTCLEMFSSIALDPEILFHHYIGWLNGEAVASSSLYLEAGVAGIYWVATVPEARRQGIGTAMTLAPLREAHALGYRIGILGSSDMGYGVYQGIGFREYFRSDYYVWTSEPE